MSVCEFVSVELRLSTAPDVVFSVELRLSTARDVVLSYSATNDILLSVERRSLAAERTVAMSVSSALERWLFTRVRRTVVMPSPLSGIQILSSRVW